MRGVALLAERNVGSPSCPWSLLPQQCPTPAASSPHMWVSPAPNCTIPDRTAGTTVSCAPPLWPSLVAVMVLVPTPTVVMTPEALTVATVVLDDCQATVRPTSTLPLASFSTAVA